MNRLLMCLLMTGCGLSQENKWDMNDSATGDNGILLGEMRISPGEINYAQVQIGQAQTAEVVLTNTGNDTLTVSSFYLDGDTAFSLNTTALSFDVEGGADVVQELTFSPTEEIDYSGTLNIWLSSESSTAQVPLTGTGSIDEVVDTGNPSDSGNPGADGGLSLSAASQNFGTVGVGTTSIKSVTVTNNGSADILIQSISSNESAFTYTSSSDVVPGTFISAGASRSLDISFTPSQEQNYSGDLLLNTDSSLTPSLSIELNGSGEEQCYICAPDIDVISNGSAADTLDSFQVSNFGNPDTQEFYIQNVGDEPLSISQILLRNDNLPFGTPFCGNAGTYTLVGNYTNRNLAPYDSLTVQVQLQYNASNGSTICGEQSLYPLSEENTIEIQSNDPDESSLFIKLGGTVTWL